MKLWKKILCAVLGPWLFFWIFIAAVPLLFPRIVKACGPHVFIFVLGVLTLLYFGFCAAGLVFLTRLLWQSAWEKIFRFSGTLLLFVLFIPYTFGPGALFVILARSRADTAMFESFSPERTWTVRIENGKKQCWQVTFQKADTPSDTTIFQTGASIYQKMKGEWMDDGQYRWNSSDIGTIVFRRKDGVWDAEPEKLLLTEETVPEESTAGRRGRVIRVKE